MANKGLARAMRLMMTLASATPSAAMWHLMTKNRFSATFSTPAADR